MYNNISIVSAGAVCGVLDVSPYAVELTRAFSYVFDSRITIVGGGGMEEL